MRGGIFPLGTVGLMDVGMPGKRMFTILIALLGVKYEDLAYTAANGFAAMGTNNGFVVSVLI